MGTKADHYLQKAEQFEAMALNAQADTTKAAYQHLARSYRQLGNHVSHSFERATEPDGLGGDRKRGMASQSWRAGANLS